MKHFVVFVQMEKNILRWLSQNDGESCRLLLGQYRCEGISNLMRGEVCLVECVCVLVSGWYAWVKVCVIEERALVSGWCVRACAIFFGREAE